MKTPQSDVAAGYIWIENYFQQTKTVVHSLSAHVFMSSMHFDEDPTV